MAANAGVKQFRPMLAATIKGNDDLLKLSYPLIGSPKVDGIRCVCHPVVGPSSRSMKPIPNRFVRANLMWGEEFVGLDGELVVGDLCAPNVFSLSSSGIMSHDGEPDFTYWVFDRLLDFNDNDSHGYIDRHSYRMPNDSFKRVKVLPHKELYGPGSVEDYEAECLALGFEGVILRNKWARYKFGRSTLREQGMMKLKRFADEEAVVVGFEPLERNLNTAEVDNLGLTKRSSKADGKVADNLLGKLLVKSDRWGEFAVGSGFDTTTRETIWLNQSSYTGKVITFKYLPHGSKDKPRHPIFKGFRHEDDS